MQKTNAQGRLGAVQPQGSAAEQPALQILPQQAISASAVEPAYGERDPGERLRPLFFRSNVDFRMMQVKESRLPPEV